MNRKEFLKKSALGILLAGGSNFPAAAFAAKDEIIKLVILHTNDQHSRVEPFPMDGSKYQGLGGFSKRKTLIDDIRATNENVLLFDSGDIFQGTPYFNKFLGEVEIKLMNEMKYDAATIGNHDFDGGLPNLSTRISQAAFPFINCNYDVSKTVLKDKIAPYKIIEKNKIKIGVIGVGIKLEGLVSKNLYEKISYTDPVKIVNDTAKFLKKNEKCSIVICLSHLGYKYDNDTISDVALAAQTADVDLILGGHTHTFLEKPVEVKNSIGNIVIVNQVGWAGINLGKIELHLQNKNIKHITKNKAIKIE